MEKKILAIIFISVQSFINLEVILRLLSFFIILILLVSFSTFDNLKFIDRMFLIYFCYEKKMWMYSNRWIFYWLGLSIKMCATVDVIIVGVNKLWF